MRTAWRQIREDLIRNFLDALLDHGSQIREVRVLAFVAWVVDGLLGEALWKGGELEHSQLRKALQATLQPLSVCAK